MTISIVVSAFDRIILLEQAIQSINNQIHSDIEILVIGDGYQNVIDTLVCSFNDKNIKYNYVNFHGYPATARNKGISLAKGQYIAFCDDDDIWHPDKLIKQVLLMEESGAGFCFSNRNHIEISGKIIANHVAIIPSNPTYKDLLKSNFITHSSVIVRRDILEQIGGFREEIMFKAVEDYDLWLRVSYHFPICCVNEDLVSYRIHNSNISKGHVSMLKKRIMVNQLFFKQHKVSLNTKISCLCNDYLKLVYRHLENIIYYNEK